MNGEKSVLDRKTVLSTLWTFAALNYVYADVVTLFDKSIATNLSQTTLLGFGALVETSFAMVLLSRLLKYNPNRLANILVAILNTVAVIASLFVQTPAPYYAFFATVEIIAGIVIIWYSWTWPKPV